MPKKIENVRELLLEETKRQILEKGYKDLNIRSVANACKLGTGTVYNYFKSKEMLVASVLLADWKEHLQEMSELACDDSKELLGGIYESLRRFARDNQRLFSDLAAKQVALSSAERHSVLRGQISAFVLPLCEKRGLNDPIFAADFISESLICWSMSGMDFDRVYPILEKIVR